MRHIMTKFLWLQAAVQQREIVLEKVKGEDNMADLMTKYLNQTKVLRILSRLGVAWPHHAGRCQNAQTLEPGRVCTGSCAVLLGDATRA